LSGEDEEHLQHAGLGKHPAKIGLQRLLQRSNDNEVLNCDQLMTTKNDDIPAQGCSPRWLKHSVRGL
jgi:hypothetical protein